MRIRLFVLLAIAALAGCMTAQPVPPSESPGVKYAKIGQTVYVDGPKVTPMAVLEDSRCPADVRCVWAGRVRLSVRIDLGSGSSPHALVLGKPIQLADGSLELIEVRPRRKTKAAIPPGGYRFGFRFMGGL